MAQALLAGADVLKCLYTLYYIILHSHPGIEISFKFIPKILMSKECIHFLGHSVYIYIYIYIYIFEILTTMNTLPRDLKLVLSIKNSFPGRKFTKTISYLISLCFRSEMTGNVTCHSTQFRTRKGFSFMDPTLLPPYKTLWRNTAAKYVPSKT